jgi:uncharacterized protein
MRLRCFLVLTVILLLADCFVLPLAAQESLNKAGATTNRHSLWKAEGSRNVVYLLGSIHLLTENDYPLAQPIESSFTNASIAVFETDIAEMERPETQLKLLTKAQLPAGETLAQHLSAGTYAAFSNHVVKIGLPAATFDQFKPMVAVMALAVIELQKLGVSADKGLDKYFFKRATKDGEQLVPLESVDFQMDLLTGFSKEEDELVMKSSLKDMDNVTKFFQDIVRAWKSGENAKLEKYLNEALSESPVLYRRLLTDRNRSWLPKIENLLRGDKNAIVIVGAGHLVGTDGLINLLKKKGFKITQL